MADDTVAALSLNLNEIVAEDCDFELAYKWMFDFCCLGFWQEFKEKSTVDKLSERNLLQGLLRHTINTLHQINLVQLMQLISYLTDGQDTTVRYSTSPGVEETPLEKALPCFDELVAKYEDLGEEVENVRDALKIQAVMVCMRADDFEQANVVLQRVWPESLQRTRKPNPQSVMRTMLISFINDKKVTQKFLALHTYERFLELAKSLLQRVYNKQDTPFLLKAVQAHRRIVEKRRLQALEDITEDASSIVMTSSKQASETDSPIKGFRHSDRLSGERNSQPIGEDKDISSPDENVEESPVNRERRHKQNCRTGANGDNDGCHDNQKLGASSGKDHGDQSDSDNGYHDNQRNERKAKGKGVKRKLPVVLTDSEENLDSSQEKNKEFAKTTSPSHNRNGRLTNGALCRDNLKMFEAVLQSGFALTEITECVSKPLVLPQTSKAQHNLQSSRRRDAKSPSSLRKSLANNTSSPAKSPGRKKLKPAPTKTTSSQTPDQLQLSSSPTTPTTPFKTPDRVRSRTSPTKPATPPLIQNEPITSPTHTTPAQSPIQVKPSPSPKPQTSDGREHNSSKKSTEGNFIKLKNTPKRGKSIRDQKYQPNRVDQRDANVPSTSHSSNSPNSFSDSDNSISPPILNSPRVRRSLDPDTWCGNGALRKVPTRKKPWTPEEVDLLKKGLRRYGAGRWAEMISKYEFNGRTNVNLKDKWRTMVKNGEI